MTSPVRGKWLTGKLIEVFAILIAIGVLAYPVHAQEYDLTVHLSSPSEGEILYAGPTSVLYSIPISGWVNHYGFDYDEVYLKLEVIQKGELIGNSTEELSHDSHFDFYVTVNPEATDWIFDPMQASCTAYCHTQSELDLPKGEVLLRVTATTPDGQSAVDERNITVDRSSYAIVPVKVVLSEDVNQVVEGIPVQASTWLYMWRARAATGSTDDQGYAYVKVEALAESPTTYVFRIDPAIVNGVRYESSDSVEVTLPPDATSAPPIVLKVTSQEGQIKGVLTNLELLDESVTVTAMRLSDNTCFKTEISEDGSFSITGLEIDKYLVTADSSVFLSHGLYANAQEIDLTKKPEASIEMPLHKIAGPEIRGRVIDEQGRPLSFAWIKLENTGKIQNLPPDSGSFMFHDIPVGSLTLVVRSPGYYSEEMIVSLSSDSVSDIDIQLSAQQGTQKIPWGDGQVIIPAESRVERSETNLAIESGWLWGYSSSGPPLTIQTGSSEIRLVNARFSLEILPNQSEWLFLFDGKAEVRSSTSPNVMTIQPNQMINLSGSQAPKSIPFNPDILSVLRPSDVPSLKYISKISLIDRISNGLYDFSVTIAQVVIYSVSAILLLAIILIPMITLYRRMKQK